MSSLADGWTEDYAAAALQEVCLRWRFDASSRSLLRFGTNAVYRVGKVVIRIARPGRSINEIQQEVALAQFLAQKDFPAMRLAGVEQPLPAAGTFASAWLWIDHDRGARVNEFDFGRLLRRFHRVTDAFDYPLPSWDQLARISDRIALMKRNPLFSSIEVAAVLSWYDEVADDLKHTGSTLGYGPIHGDAHTGNVLVTDAGPILIDFDHLCTGPREWDLIPAALAFRRFGSEEAAYRNLLRGYDIAEVEGWDIYVRLRELSAATWLFSMESGTSRSEESERRLRVFLGDSTPPMWSAK